MAQKLQLIYIFQNRKFGGETVARLLVLLEAATEVGYHQKRMIRILEKRILQKKIVQGSTK